MVNDVIGNSPMKVTFIYVLTCE